MEEAKRFKQSERGHGTEDQAGTARAKDSGTRRKINPKPRVKDIVLLEWLVDYELRCSARYRRYATLVLVACMGQHASPRTFLGDCLRNSDEFFEFDGTAAILMGETDGAGAFAAVERYKNAISRKVDLRFAIASYPADTTDTAELLWTAHRRLDRAKSRSAGEVVTNG